LKRQLRARSFCRLEVVLLLTVLLQLVGCEQSPAPLVRNGDESQRNPYAKVTAVRHDLARDEERGGHTLKKHVGRTDEQLQERLRQERNIAAASTWTDRETAEVTVADALRAERDRIENWMIRGYPRANLALHYDAGRVIGRSVKRGENQSVNCSSAVIVLRGDGPHSFFILTSYPEASE
jgi:hypothetical protein